MHIHLINHISKYVELTPNAVDLIRDSFKALSLKNKDYLLREGELCKWHFFVAKGGVRLFFYSEKGAEQITQFAIENWWITDYFSFLDQTQSGYTIQAIEKSEVLAIDLFTYNKLLDDVPALERYFRIMAQRALAASQHRLKLTSNLSKEAMYLHFKASFPQFMQRIPQYMLASFLGLSPEYLSELRKKHS